MDYDSVEPSRRPLAASGDLGKDENLNDVSRAAKVIRRNTFSASIPVELLEEEILCKLPVKVLTRFKCVCKSLRDIISSKEFIALHLKKYETSNLVVNSVYRKTSLITPMYLYPETYIGPWRFKPPNSTLININKIPSAVEEENLFPYIAGICNGIICYYGKHPDNILLLNPATKQARIIPESDIPRREKPVSRCGCKVVFGYDAKSDDYKIIQVLYSYGSKYASEFEIYSLNTNLWKKLDTHDVVTSPKVSFFDGGYSSGDNIVCWLVKYYDFMMDPERWEIVLFDMCTERFEIVQVPVEVVKCKVVVSLIPFKKSIEITKGVPSGNMWVLNDIYSTGGLKYWTKVSLSDLIPHFLWLIQPKPVGFWVDCFLVSDHKPYPPCTLHMYDYGYSPIYFDVQLYTREWVHKAFLYKESLVRLH